MENRYTDGTYLSQNPSWHAEDAPWKLAHIRRVLAQVPTLSYKRVLDAGCGSGDIIKLWAVSAPHVQFTGWDISPQAHALAVQHAPANVRFVQTLAQDPVDLALAIDVIEHLEQPDLWISQLAQLSAYLVLHVPLDLSVRSWLFPSLLERERQAVGHIHFLTARTLTRFLHKQNCQIVAAHYTNKYVERPPQLTRFKSRVGMFIRRAADRLLPQSWAAFLVGGYSLMLVVKTRARSPR